MIRASDQPLFEGFARDAAHAARALLKRPAFTIIAIITIALGIGANTAIFSIIRGVLLQPVALVDSQRLVAIGEAAKTGPLTAVPYLNYLDWKAHAQSFTDMSARLPAGGILGGEDQPERIFGRFVSANFFRTLLVSPQAGRFFNESEDKIGGEHVMVLSDALWRRHFGADPSVIGRSVTYNAEVWTVIGVLPRDFDFYGQSNDNNDFFIPIGQLEQRDSRGRGYPVRITARLRDGVSEAAARAEIQSLARQSALQFPESDTGNKVELRSFLADYVGDTTQPLLVVLAAVFILLLIACANVASLTLARGSARQKEIALRLALGASRARIIRLLLAESTIIAMIGGGLGLLASAWAIQFFKRVAGESLPRLGNVHIDAWVLAATACATLVSAIGFGLVPAVQSTRPDLETALKGSGRAASANARTHRMRKGLVVAQIALSLMLLVCAGLLLTSFRRLMTADPGFDAQRVLTFRLRLPDKKYQDANKTVQFLRESRRRFEELPGVQSVAVGTGFPLGRSIQASYWMEGTPAPRNLSEWPLSRCLSVSSGYYHTLGIPLLAGRLFTEQDRAETAPVVIVDEDFVRQNFGTTEGQVALGSRVRLEGEGEQWREIVGVVRHVRHSSLEEESGAELYRPWTQMDLNQNVEWLRAMDVLVKTAADPHAMIPKIRDAIHELDPAQPLGPAATLDDLLTQSTAPRRMNLGLIVTFAGLALTLCAVGLYGLMSYLVTERTREIGVRMALGAERSDVLRLILGHGLTLAAVGIALGIVAAIVSTRLLGSLLYGISPSHAATYVLMALFLLGITLLACYFPARQATRVDPVESLRYE